jgi:hypothetical protein
MQPITFFKRLSHSLITGILLIASSAIYAEQQWCSGVISHVWVDKVGATYITGSWRREHTQICNLSNEWKGVSPNTCRSWLGLAQHAHATQISVVLQYADVPSCKDIPYYGYAPSPNYVMLAK